MNLKRFKYERLAYIIVQRGLEEIEGLKSEGLKTGPFDADHAINNYLPREYDDNNIPEGQRGWTRHNQKVLKQYIKTELQRREYLRIMEENKKVPSKPELTKEALVQYLKEKCHEKYEASEQPYQEEHEISFSQGAYDALEELAVHFGLSTYGEFK